MDDELFEKAIIGLDPDLDEWNARRLLSKFPDFLFSKIIKFKIQKFVKIIKFGFRCQDHLRKNGEESGDVLDRLALGNFFFLKTKNNIWKYLMYVQGF